MRVDRLTLKMAGQGKETAMDVVCTTCREPVDNDYLHEIAEEQDRPYPQVLAAFQRDGCEALGEQHNPEGRPSPTAALIYELLGDDIDGAMSELDMWDRQGLL